MKIRNALVGLALLVSSAAGCTRLEGDVLSERYTPPTEHLSSSTYVFKLSTSRGVYDVSVKQSRSNDPTKEEIDYLVNPGATIAIYSHTNGVDPQPGSVLTIYTRDINVLKPAPSEQLLEQIAESE